MKTIFVILLLLVTAFSFSLDAQPIDKAAAQRMLQREQTAATKYQEQSIANKKIIEDMVNDAKKKDYQERLSKLRYKKTVLEFNIKKKHTTEEKEKLLTELDAVTEEYSNLQHEFEAFVNSLN